MKFKLKDDKKLTDISVKLADYKMEIFSKIKEEDDLWFAVFWHSAMFDLCSILAYCNHKNLDYSEIVEELGYEAYKNTKTFLESDLKKS